MSGAQKWCLGLILLTSVILSTAYNVLQPIWEAPDEPAHFGYIRYVQLHHALPRATPDLRAFTEPWDLTSEFSQAPLYYVLLATVLQSVRLLPEAQPHLNPYVAWPGHPWREAVALHRTDEGWPYHGLALFVHLGRLASTVFGLITLLATFGLVVTVTHRASIALFAVSWLAWSPVFVLTSARLDNDAVAMATGALCLLTSGRLLMKRDRARLLDLVPVGLCLTGALLSKLDTVFLIPLVVVATIVGAEPGKPLLASWGRRLVTTALVLVVPLASLAGWWIRYGRTSAAVIGVKAGFGVLQIGAVAEGIDRQRLLAALGNWNATWWGGVGWGTLTPWPPVVYAALAIPFLGLAGAGVYTLVRGNGWRNEEEPEKSSAVPLGSWPSHLPHFSPQKAMHPSASWCICLEPERFTAILLALSIVPIFYATIARAAVPAIGLDSNARFTLPAAPVIALLVALGAQAIPKGRPRRLVDAAYLSATLGLAVATAVILLPRIPAPRIPARLAANNAELTSRALASFANGIDLLAAHSGSPTLRPGENVSVDLQWRVRSTPARDFTASVQILDATERRRVAGADAIPFERSFPPRLWQPGEIVDDARQVTLPPSLAPGLYLLSVGTYYLEQNTPRPIQLRTPGASGDTVVVGSWVVLPDSSGLAQAQPAAALFGPNLRLRGYTVQEDGGAERVSLYWEARSLIRRNLVVSVQLLGAEGRPISQSDGEPVGGRLPTTVWPVGQVVRDDHILPARGGSKQLPTIVVVYDRQSLQRLPVQKDGGPIADHLTLGNSGV